MPIEIRELQINVTVNQPGENSAAPAGATTQNVPGDATRNLVNQCIEEVMEILHNKQER